MQSNPPMHPQMMGQPGIGPPNLPPGAGGPPPTGPPVAGPHGNQGGAGADSRQPIDHVTKVRQMVWQLKESLANMMRVAAAHINHNSAVDSGAKVADEKLPRLDRTIEDFFALCNQIEIYLKTIGECSILQRDSTKYFPFHVNSKLDATGPIDNQTPFDAPISYSQYVTTIKQQFSYARQLQEILLEAGRQVRSSDQPPQAPMSQQPVPMPSSQPPKPEPPGGPGPMGPGTPMMGHGGPGHPVGQPGPSPM